MLDIQRRLVNRDFSTKLRIICSQNEEEYNRVNSEGLSISLSKIRMLKRKKLEDEKKKREVFNRCAKQSSSKINIREDDREKCPEFPTTPIPNYYVVLS